MQDLVLFRARILRATEIEEGAMIILLTMGRVDALALTRTIAKRQLTDKPGIKYKGS